MSKTFKHQDLYDYYHDKKLPWKKLVKLYNFFSRINFWDPDEKIKFRRIKDFKHGGGIARIKIKKYK